MAGDINLKSSQLEIYITPHNNIIDGLNMIPKLGPVYNRFIGYNLITFFKQSLPPLMVTHKSTHFIQTVSNICLIQITLKYIHFSVQQTKGSTKLKLNHDHL